MASTICISFLVISAVLHWSLTLTTLALASCLTIAMGETFAIIFDSTSLHLMS